MILRCEDPSFHWAASIKSIYSTKPMVTSNLCGMAVTDVYHDVLGILLGFVE